MNELTAEAAGNTALKSLASALQRECQGIGEANRIGNTRVIVRCLSKMHVILRLLERTKAASYCAELRNALQQRSEVLCRPDATMALARAVVLLSHHCIENKQQDTFTLSELNRLRAQSGRRSIGENSINVGDDIVLKPTEKTFGLLCHFLHERLRDIEALYLQSTEERRGLATGVQASAQNIWRQIFAVSAVMGKATLMDTVDTSSTGFVIEFGSQLTVWGKCGLNADVFETQYCFAKSQSLLSRISILMILKEKFGQHVRCMEALNISAQFSEKSTIFHRVFKDCSLTQRMLGFVCYTDPRVKLIQRLLIIEQRVCCSLECADVQGGKLLDQISLFARCLISTRDSLHGLSITLDSGVEEANKFRAHWGEQIQQIMSSLRLFEFKCTRQHQFYRRHKVADVEITQQWSLSTRALEKLLCERPDTPNELIFTTWSVLPKLCAMTGNTLLLAVVDEFGELITCAQENRFSIADRFHELMRRFVNVMRMGGLPFLSTEKSIGNDLRKLFISIRNSIWEFNIANSARVAESVDVDALGIVNELNVGFTFERWPSHLAQNLRRLLMWTQSIKGVEYPSGKFSAMNRSLLLELRVLWVGSRTLKVYRITQASEILMRLHQQLAVGMGSGDYDSIKAKLHEAHDGLRVSLNQAAARRSVFFSKDLLEQLKQDLDSLEARREAGLCSDKFRDVFADETLQRLNTIALSASHLIALSKVPRRTPRENDNWQDEKSTMLRELHTLKGSARLFAESPLSQMCHRCEQVLLDCTGTEELSSVTEFSQALERLEMYAKTLVSSGAESKTASSISEPTKELHSRVNYRVMELINKIAADQDAMMRVLAEDTPYKTDTKIDLLESLLAEHSVAITQLREVMSLSSKKNISSIIPRLNALAKSRSQSQKKKVEFRVNNAQLDVDASIVELLLAPLEHLLRNAIDHGIELPGERLARGKPEHGTITLSFCVLDTRQLSIDLSDDGAGIILEGADTASSFESSDSTLGQLCQIGFSTKELVSEDAGHGIGLASVKHALSYLRGQLTMSNSSGEGVSFNVLLPLT